MQARSLTERPFQSVSGMGNIFNDDFRDFIDALNRYDVKYVLVGGMAVILNGYVRTTGDMDVWVKRDAENYVCLVGAFRHFGMSVFDMTQDKFLSTEYDVWTFGVSPVRIDLMTEVKGLDFDGAFKNAQYYTESGTSFRFLRLENLIQAKQASGRHRDIDDIEQLSKR